MNKVSFFFWKLFERLEDFSKNCEFIGKGKKKKDFLKTNKMVDDVWGDDRGYKSMKKSNLQDDDAGVVSSFTRRSKRYLKLKRTVLGVRTIDLIKNSQKYRKGWGGSAGYLEVVKEVQEVLIRVLGIIRSVLKVVKNGIMEDYRIGDRNIYLNYLKVVKIVSMAEKAVLEIVQVQWLYNNIVDNSLICLEYFGFIIENRLKVDGVGDSFFGKKYFKILSRASGAVKGVSMAVMFSFWNTEFLGEYRRVKKFHSISILKVQNLVRGEVDLTVKSKENLWGVRGVLDRSENKRINKLYNHSWDILEKNKMILYTFIKKSRYNSVIFVRYWEAKNDYSLLKRNIRKLIEKRVGIQGSKDMSKAKKKILLSRVGGKRLWRYCLAVQSTFMRSRKIVLKAFKPLITRGFRSLKDVKSGFVDKEVENRLNKGTYKDHILRRRFYRRRLYGAKLFRAGDIVSIEFESVGYVTRFKGICIRKNCKLFLDINSSYLLRNFVLGVGVELHIPVYWLGSNFLAWKLYDHERKRFKYRASRLYYLRSKLNRESLVKYFII